MTDPIKLTESGLAIKTYSFRAECSHDVDQLVRELSAAGIAHWMTRKELELPDVAVELKIEADIDSVMDVMRKVADSHVMQQTLRECELSENSLERDYDVKTSTSPANKI